MSSERAYSETRARCEIAERVLDLVLGGEPCPVCKQQPGAHRDGCPVASVVIHEPRVLARSRVNRKEGRHG